MTAGIKQDGMSVIANLLRSQIYKDNILATIRETVSNSTDANVEAGNGMLPIQVTLPSRFNPVFKTRDFGKGISDEDIVNIYMWYGCSTKNSSNDFTGCLGIGRFAPLSYADNFVVTSYVNGVKNVFNVFIDSTDNNQIAKIHSETSSEPNGVEISVAVKDRDVNAFCEKAATIFRHFKVKPEVNGLPFVCEKATPIIEGQGWRVVGGVPVAVMGNVGYNIDNHWSSVQSISRVLSAGIEMDFPIGELEVSASREGLKYSDRTKKAIETKLLSIAKEITDIINKKFADCKTLVEANKLYGQIMNYGSPLYYVASSAKNFCFKNRTINDNKIHFFNPSDLSNRVSRFEKSWRGSRISSNPVSSIECDEKTLLIDNDLNIRSGIINRVHTSVMSGRRVYLISYTNDAYKKQFLYESGIEQSDMTPLSSLPKISLTTPGSSVSAHNPKHTSKEFVLEMNPAPSRSYNRNNSDYWRQEPVDLDNDAGVYVELDRFEYKNQTGGLTTPATLIEIVASLLKMGIKIDKIYGFKKDSAESAKKNSKMINFFDYLKDELNKHFTKNNISQKVANRIQYDANCNFNWLGILERYCSEAKPKTLCFKTAKIFAHMKCEKDSGVLDACVAWKAYLSPATPEYELSQIREAFEKQYPLIPMVRTFYSHDDETKKAVLNYVNLIDG